MEIKRLKDRDLKKPIEMKSKEPIKKDKTNIIEGNKRRSKLGSLGTPQGPRGPQSDFWGTTGIA